MKRIISGLVVLFAAACARGADLVLVDGGRPRAEIVVAENPPRTVRLAVHELQTYVEKISGAKLPIVTEPSPAVPVQIYVGRSLHTDRLKITAEGLRDGAYRIASGDGRLVLIGDDADFTPIEPWAKNNAEIAGGKLQREWDRITGALWGAPYPTLYKNRINLPGDVGRPTNAATTGKLEPLQLWGFDERGSFNAVCGLLHKLGVRWYLPGELGEVVPTSKTIALPPIDEIVRPDFPLRRFNFRFGVHGRDTTMWAMRLGVRDPFGIQVAHGMDDMTHRDEIFAAHPDWFALYGGKRQNQPGQRLNQLCYSNEELFQETVRYVRAQFDHYKFDAVSVMPPDGYTAICQCPSCEGKDSPERDNRGLLSDYVWDFVNRVAKEVGKTHPDRKVLNCAYGVYTLPPLKIAKLEPNVVVSIVGGRRPTADEPEEQEELRKLREEWAAKTDNPIIIFENYPFTDRGWYLPSFVPHVLGASINATKGMSQGEDIWLSMRQDFDTTAIGFNHFLVYFTARMYWGGKEQDVDAMFREYCRLFYGPAEKEMLAFFDYCEANWREMEKDKAKADAALSLFAAAQAKAEPSSVYGRRLALIDDYLKGLRSKSAQLGRKRGPVPQLRLVGDASPIVVDGKLDDAYWRNCPVASTGRLRELQTGGTPTFGTSFQAGWFGGSVYFAIRCDERPGDRPNVAATKPDDSAIWYGDVVEILLETESRSYYQIAVNPAGAVADLDRSAPRNAWFGWDSQAEAAVHVADDHWTVEIRIPVVEDENDPLHQVIGRRPTKSLPWHVNVCRQRIRENGQEHSAFSPTGADNFHDVMKFAHFYDGNSHQFDAAEPDADYLAAAREASQLLTRRRFDAAAAAFAKLADGPVTDFQKSAALEQAAAAAEAAGKHDRAGTLAERIPIEAVRKSAHMQLLLAQRQAPQLIERFAAEDLGTWPFWKAGDGYFARGRAYAITGAGKEAEVDLLRALEFVGDVRVRTAVRLALGDNRERHLKDDDGALAAYRQIVDSTKQIGAADEFSAVQGAARILVRRGKFDDALAVLRRVEIDKLRGYWRGSMLLSMGDVLRSAGRNDEALAAYRSVLADDSTEPRHRQAAERAIEAVRNGASRTK